MRSKFTPQTRAALVAHIRQGGALAQACRESDIGVKTVEGWITRGRRDRVTEAVLGEGVLSEYAEFAKSVDAARELAAAEVVTEGDVVKMLERAAKKGSVSAMKILLGRFEKQRKAADGEGQSDDPFDDLEGDELAPRRAARTPA